jgi:hypothetical protein
MLKRLLLLTVILFAVVAFAKEKASDVTAIVHVSSSRSVDEVFGTTPIENTSTHEVYGQTVLHSSYLVLTTTIDGHKYDLKSVRYIRRRQGLLEPGDYQAKVSESRHGRVYELLLTSGKTQKFEVIGTSE